MTEEGVHSAIYSPDDSASENSPTLRQGSAKTRLAIWAFTFLLTITIVLSMISRSPEFSNFSAYVPDEVHTVGPAYEVYEKKELFFRCSTFYAVGESQCTSFSVLFDGWFLRFIHVFFPLGSFDLSDSEWVNPVVQWALLLKRGFFVSALLLLWLSLLKRLYRHSWIPYLLVLSFVSSHLLGEHGFELKPDGEVGACISILFTVFVIQNLYRVRFSSWIWGAMLGLMGSIRIPVMPFAALSCRSFRVALAAIGVMTLLCLGLFRSSWEFLGTRVALHFGSYNEHSLSRLQNMDQNLFLIFKVHGLGWLAVFCLGFLLYRMFRRNPFYVSAMTGLCFLYMSAGLSQPRFFVGAWGILLISFAYVLEQAFIRFSGRFKAQIHYLGWIGAIGTCLFLLIQSIPGAMTQFRAAHRYFENGEVATLPAEKLILNLLATHPMVYVDQRIRPNLREYPLRNWTTHLQVVDLLNDFERIPAESPVVLPCFDAKELKSFGIESLGAVADFLTAPCRTKAKATEASLIAPHNTRFFPIRTNEMVSITWPKTGLPTRLLIQDSVDLSLIGFTLSHPSMQEWETQISTLSLAKMKARHEYRFAAQKTLRVQKGDYNVSVNVRSNHREPSAHLKIFSEGQLVSDCPLDTTEAFVASGKNRWLIHLPFYQHWKTTHFPITCRARISQKQTGLLDLKLEVVAQEPERWVRFQTLKLSRIVLE